MADADPKASTASPEARGQSLMSLLGRNLLWALGSLAGAVGGAIVLTICFVAAGFVVGFVGEQVLHLETSYDMAQQAGAFAAAGGVLIGGVIGSYIPLVAIGEGQQRMHEKVLAIAVVIGIFLVLWRIDSDTVFSAGWLGLVVAVGGFVVLAGALALFDGFRKKK